MDICNTKGAAYARLETLGRKFPVPVVLLTHPILQTGIHLHCFAVKSVRAVVIDKPTQPGFRQTETPPPIQIMESIKIQR